MMIKKAAFGALGLALLAFPILTSAQSTCPTLAIGSTGASVTALQTFLHKAYTDFPSPTGRFGPLTQAALKQWQGEHGIEKAGMLGPKTRAAMGLSCTPTSSTAVTKPAAPSSNAALIQALLAQLKILQEKLAALIAAQTTVSATTTVPVLTYTWQTGGWSTCTNATQSRTASCISSQNAVVADSYCTTTKPSTSQSCTVTTTQSCTWNGQTVAHGASVTAYQSSSVPAGSQCVSQTRPCTNGTLSGSYQFASCTPAVPPPPAREYFFGPDLQRTVDYMDLFTPGAEWTDAASRIQYFGLDWRIQLMSDAQLQQIILGLKQRGIKLMVGAGPLNSSPETCGVAVEGFNYPGWAVWSDRIKSLGGTIDVASFDEPYYYAHTYDGVQACHWSAADIALKIDALMKEMRARFPDITFWDAEPMFVGTNTDRAANEAWLDAFKQATGYALPGLLVEFDPTDPNAGAQLKLLEQYAKQHGTRFGVLYDSPNSAASNAQWVATAGKGVVNYELQNGGNPDAVVFTSWVDKPDRALPESTTGTFTNFISRYFTDKANLGTLFSSTSDARTEFISGLYTCVLGRAPDASGLAGWVSLPAGTTFANIFRSFFASTEYLSKGTSNETYVGQLYQCVLGRQGDQGGITGWVNVLSSGGSRDDVLNSFVTSSEFVGGRGATLQAQTGWVL